MTPKTLRVRAHGDASVPNYERPRTQSFIGRKFVEKPDAPGQFAFVATDEVVEVPYRAEYIKALKDGELTPADDETARAAGLKLDAHRAAEDGGDR